MVWTASKHIVSLKKNCTLVRQKPAEDYFDDCVFDDVGAWETCGMPESLRQQHHRSRLASVPTCVRPRILASHRCDLHSAAFVSRRLCHRIKHNAARGAPEVVEARVDLTSVEKSTAREVDEKDDERFSIVLFSPRTFCTSRKGTASSIS